MSSDPPITNGAVRWPAQACDHAGTDLAAPMTALLRQADVLGDEADQADGATGLNWATPPSLQVIEAGASSLSKWMAGVVASLGGASVVLGTIGASWEAAGESLQIALVVAAAVLLAAVVIAIALIVRADLAARSTATAAQYEARAALGNAFIHGAVTHRPAEYMVMSKGGAWAPVKEITYDDDHGGLVMVTEDGDRMPHLEIYGVQRLVTG